MTFAESFAALFSWREPRSNAVPDDEREARRMNETKTQWLKRLERLER